ncbi:hypothetical protein BMW22_15625 [Rhizobium leguminosarum]|uniref:Uncharacterized protein n=1 Tax=Rhizobium leguminosarum TaxID=384 RepID=A0A1L3ZB22_RHILE|nr:hypothetical protein [Rhizobium leguminosarum]API52854.1 hypothetical protein BMW22_15625 [Rhizobium leguminosarum]
MTGVISANGLSGPGGVSFVPGTVVPANGAVVTDGQSKNLTGPDGTVQFGTVTLSVSGGSMQSAKLPTNSTVITTQAGGVNVQDADGTNVGCTPVIVSQTGQLSYVSVPGTAALVTNGLSVKVANNGGGGALDGNASITGGFINWIALAAQTDTLISNGFTTTLNSFVVSASTDFATVNVASGGLQSVTVSLAPTKAVVTNAQQLTIPVTGTYTTTATLTVAGGAVTAIVLS